MNIGGLVLFFCLVVVIFFEWVIMLYGIKFKRFDCILKLNFIFEILNYVVNL